MHTSIEIAIEGIQSTSVQGVAKSFKRFCVENAISVKGPIMKKEGRKVFELRDTSPPILLKNKRIYIASLVLVESDELMEKITTFRFPSSVNVCIPG